ncbi:MAG: OadG family protein [Thermoanaerobaculia bacterium]
MSFVLYVTAVGMGVVFTVLGLLWGLLSLLTKFDRVEVEHMEIDPEVAAAVTIAVLMHRTARRRQAAPETRSTWPGTQLFASRWLAAGRTRQTRAWQGRR